MDQANRDDNHGRGLAVLVGMFAFLVTACLFAAGVYLVRGPGEMPSPRTSWEVDDEPVVSDSILRARADGQWVDDDEKKKASVPFAVLTWECRLGDLWQPHGNWSQDGWVVGFAIKDYRPLTEESEEAGMPAFYHEVDLDKRRLKAFFRTENGRVEEWSPGFSSWGHQALGERGYDPSQLYASESGSKKFRQRTSDATAVVFEQDGWRFEFDLAGIKDLLEEQRCD